MIKYVYGFRNKLSGNFGDPRYEVLEKDDAVEAYTISAKEASQESKVLMKELELYYLGTFDTKTGKAELVDPESLLAFDGIINGEQKVP